MGLKSSSLGPVVGFVVVIDVAKQKTLVCLVNNQPDVAADPHGPEVLVLRLVELVETHARIGRIELQVEGCGFDGFLFLFRQTGKTVGESVGDEKIHNYSDLYEQTVVVRSKAESG